MLKQKAIERTDPPVATRPKPIWIDLDNSPHVPFFAPIIGELESRGYAITVTVRDAFQACELANLFELQYQQIGRHYGKNRVCKVGGTCLRALQLVRALRSSKPDLAISHGSRSQLLASRLLGVPMLMMWDYEFIHLPKIIHPEWTLIPEVVETRADALDPKKVLRYPGIKEDVYAPLFRPDSSILRQLGIGDGGVIVTARPPASEAHYHCPESDALFGASLQFVFQSPSSRVILLPRTVKQAQAMRALWRKEFDSGRILIPEHVLDGLNLIWHSDLVIGGGGTMNREAAALGVPVYSVFRSKIGAVDRYLARTGRLTLLESTEDVRTKVILQKRRPDLSPRKGYALLTIVEQVVSLVEFGKPAVLKAFGDASEVVMKGANS